MATTWARLAGDTSKFAIEIAFSDDPDQGTGATPEESSSWGGLQIWVNERNLCANQSNGESSGAVHWYLLPFIEWWVKNWDPIFHEERLPNRNKADCSQVSLEMTREAPGPLSAEESLLWDQTWYDWWARHCVEASRAGGVFPSIYFRRWRDEVEVSWDGARPAGSPSGIQFVQSSGSFRLRPEDVVGALHAVLSEATSYLRSRCPTSERLARLRDAVSELQSAREDRLAWLLGLGGGLPSLRESLAAVRQAVADLPVRTREAILGNAAEPMLFIEPFPAALMFGAVSPDLSASDSVELLHRLGSAYGGPQGRVDELATHEPVDGESAWRQGYELAENALEEPAIRGGIQAIVDVEAILGDLGVSVQEVSLDDRSIRAAAIGGAEYRPTILLNTSHRSNHYPTGRRFSLAHELCHLLYDRAFARGVALPSGPWAPRDVERRANAFAAMLLMPPDRIREAIASSASDPESPELIRDVATRLQTSFTATVEHMCNLMMLSEEGRDSLLEEAMDQSGRG